MSTSAKDFTKALLLGGLFPLAFAPIALPQMAFLSLLLFYIFIQKRSLKENIWLGYAYGLGKYGVGVSWIFVSIDHFSNAPWFIAVLITLLFIAGLSLFELASFAISHLVTRRLSPLLKSFQYALVATLFEWLRSTLFTGFPWLLFAYSQVNSPLKGFAPLVGVFGLSFICYLSAFIFGAGFIVMRERIKAPYFIFSLALLPFVVGHNIDNISWTQRTDTPLNFTLIQGNVPRDQKWQSTHFDDILLRYFNITEQHWQSDLIVWPETAIPVPSKYVHPLLKQLSHHAKAHQTDLLVGIPGSNPNGSYSNSLFLLGSHKGRYDKHHLVPFGEYLPIQFLKPFIKYFDIPLANVTENKRSATVLRLGKHYLAPFICYDIAYTDNLLNALPKAELLLTISDAAWFGQSLAKGQQLQISVMRSLQSQRPQLIASNNGYTALIDKNGNIIKRLKPNTIGALRGNVYGAKGLTPWAKVGDNPFILLFLCLLSILLVYQHTDKLICLPPIARLIKKAYALRLR